MSAASRTPASYFSFVVVGIAMVGVFYSCFTIPDLVRQELVAGTFDRLLLSPFGGGAEHPRDGAVPAALLVRARGA